jgi:hypothetical protein
MADLTPQNEYPIPSEFDEPYFATAKSYYLATDLADWSLAENDNLIWSGGGTFSWNATTSTLTWSSTVELRTKTTFRKTTIAGPPTPGGILVLQDGEVAFFQYPRLLVADKAANLVIGPITSIPGIRLCDITIFATRIGTTMFFADGKSLKDGESAELFGAGVGTLVQPHEHQDAKVIEPPTAGVSLLDLNIASFFPGIVRRVKVFRNGELQNDPDDYTVNTATGIVTLINPTIRPNILDPFPERFITFIETYPPHTTTGEHKHLAPRIIEPIAGTGVLDMLVDSTDYPALARIELYRNGSLQSEPADYSLDLPTGLVSLVSVSVLGERFTAFREVQF